MPIVRFHTRWNELTYEDFHPFREGAKTGYIRPSVRDVSSFTGLTDKRESLPDYYMDSLLSVLDYSDQENLNILFVISPQYLSDEIYVARLNTAIDIIRNRNYPVLDMNRARDEMTLDPAVDYLDERHVNIHGSLKFTDYLSRYLIDNYDLKDKRGDPGYTSWDEAYEKYSETVMPYLTEEELNTMP